MPKRSWKLDDPLFESLPKYDKDRTQELLDLIQSNKDTPKDELILQLLALCKIILQRFLRGNHAIKRNLPDIIGILMLRTCAWVDTLKHGPKNNVKSPSYYWQLVKNEINDFKLDGTNPNVSGAWLCRQARHGKLQPQQVYLKEDLLQINPTETLELEDILITLAETEQERGVVILRFNGYTDAEIATQFNTTRRCIQLIRAGLESRYDHYLQRNNQCV